MKQFIILFAFVVFASCDKKVTQEELKYLNGYWEITEVIFPDGEKKSFDINETIDYIEWSDSLGIRKKVKPQLDGTFLVNDEDEKITVKEQSGQWVLIYQTRYDRWEEKIVELQENKLILQNEQQIRYHYKKYESLNLP
jgi:hypothetical protein